MIPCQVRASKHEGHGSQGWHHHSAELPNESRVPRQCAGCESASCVPMLHPSPTHTCIPDIDLVQLVVTLALQPLAGHVIQVPPAAAVQKRCTACACQHMEHIRAMKSVCGLSRFRAVSDILANKQVLQDVDMVEVSRLCRHFAASCIAHTAGSVASPVGSKVVLQPRILTITAAEHNTRQGSVVGPSILG